jgi:hypothetical protein
MPGEDSDATLDIYKLAVAMADAVSSRRAGANTFFLTLNTTLAAVVGVVSAARKPSLKGATVPSFDGPGLVLTAVAGIVLALVWWMLLKYYRRLNAAKFTVITRLESDLPVKPYTEEWAILRPNESGDQGGKVGWWHIVKQWGRWRGKTKHREATVVEQVVPLVFVAIYVALAVRILVG